MTIGFCIIYLSILILITSLYDPASACEIFVIMISALALAILHRNVQNKYVIKLTFLISSVYITSAIIISNTFSETSYFLASDPIRYIASVRNCDSVTTIIRQLQICYLDLADNNGLYNSMLYMIGLLCKTYHVEATSLAITLPQTLFGILTIIMLFRILCNYYSEHEAFKYTLVFGLFSLTFLYSAIIVRDVVLEFLFTVGLAIVLKKFSVWRLVSLFLLVAIVMGIRLYSAVFFCLFIIFYLYQFTNGKKYHIVIKFFSIIALFPILSSAFWGSFWEQSVDEFDLYNTWQNELAFNVGLSGKLRQLPPGLSQLSLMLYSQANPFPPYSVLVSIQGSNWIHIYMGVLILLTSVWWFFISYTAFYFFFLKKDYKKLSLDFRLLYLIALIIVGVSVSMHVDIRRLLPAYPIIYLIYLKYVKSIETIHEIHKGRNILCVFYITVILLYSFIKI